MYNLNKYFFPPILLSSSGDISDHLKIGDKNFPENYQHLLEKLVVILRIFAVFKPNLAWKAGKKKGAYTSLCEV